MEINVWLVLEDEHGNHLRVVSVERDTSLPGLDARELRQPDVEPFLMHFGMVYSVFVMKDSNHSGCNVYVKELLQGKDVIDVLIDLILSGDLVVVSAWMDILCMALNVWLIR